MRHLLIITALVMASGTALAGPAPSETEVVRLSESSDWRDRQKAALAVAWRDDPAAAQALMDLEPGTTRAGGPRFVPPTRDAGATAVLLDRFLSGTDDPAVRAALLDALARTEGEWAPGVADAFGAESSAAVRVVMCEVLRRQPAAIATPVLRGAAKDADPAVREAAARSMGWTEDALWASSLVQALGDADARVRSAAARSLGWVGAVDAWSALLAATADVDADVRRRSVRALERLDAERASQEPVIKAMVADPDPKVARAARQVSGD